MIPRRQIIAHLDVWGSRKQGWTVVLFFMRLAWEIGKSHRTKREAMIEMSHYLRALNSSIVMDDTPCRSLCLWLSKESTKETK